MTRRFVGVVLGGLAAPGLALAQVAPDAGPAITPALAATPASTGDPAVALLVRQGQHWLDEGRPDLASLSVERALSAEPNDVDALLLAARIAAARNNRAASSAYIARLRSAGATPEQQAAANAALRAGSIDPAALEAARRLAREGHAEEAAARYRSLFGPGEPPPVYAREYYQVLASAESTRAAGLSGLAQLAAQPNADDRTRLANAEALTYSASTRADGIARLSALADHPAVSAQAQADWKQALGFESSNPAAAPQLETYLKRFPNDADIAQQLAAARAAQPAAPSPGDVLRQSAFASLNSGALSTSETQFTQALAANPTSADALGGLGIVRLRQNRPADAKDLLERAIAADPAHAAQWKRALDGANYTLELANARVLLRRGDTAGADTVLRQAVGRDVEDSTDAESMLGEVSLKRGDAKEAEQHFRAALARRPGFPPSMAGLNQALRAQGRLAEAPVAAPSASRGYAPAQNASTSATDQARAEAARTADPATQVALLSNAMATAPDDPWLRLDLARSLRRVGRGAEGRALVEELAARRPSPDADYAAALLAQEDGRASDALAFLGRIPLTRMTPDMARLQVRVRQQSDVASAAALLPTAPIEARQRLVVLAARPDPTGGTAADAIRALGNAGDRIGADQAGRAAELTNPQPSARIAIAGALLAAGLDADAMAMAGRLDNSRLTEAQRRDVATLRINADVRVSDQLNESGNQAAAFNRLRPALASTPDSPDVQLALARLYQGARQPAEAMRIADAVLARDPRNADARAAAVDAAIAAGDRRRAEALANEGVAIAPGDSRAILLQARVARAFGDNIRARTLLAQAATQRQAELGTATDTPAGASGQTLQNPFATPGSAALTPDGAAPQDRVARQIAQEQAAVQTDTASRVSGGVIVRSRSGTAGLDQLTDVSSGIEASFVPDGFGGRITARATPVLLNNGTLTGTANALRFGSNAASGTALAPSDTSETGAGLNVAYQRGNMLTVDAGSSPLGFPVATLLGGIEVAPKLTDQITLRLKAERRSVTDSLLSYAGERDPVTGTTWGGVTRNSGHAQIESGLGAGFVYAGAGYALYEGQHVEQNTEIEGGSGFGYPFYKQGDSELTGGLNVVYFRYENNQRAFTLGQGGYFSPQNFVAVNLPFDYRSTWGDLRYHVGATVGYAEFREEASPLFPLNPGLQAAAEAEALVNPTIPTNNLAQNKTGFVGGVRIDLHYPLSDRLSLVGGLTYDQAADWQEARVSVRLENRF
jgi:cellulose synthase operon protein C